MKFVLACILLGIAMAPWIGRLDIYLAHLFFNSTTGEWLVPSGRPLIWYFFYRGPKFFLGGLAFCMLVALACSLYMPNLKPFRIPLLISLLTLGLTPGASVWLKHVTDVYCPNQTTLFGGKFLYTDLFELHPVDILRTKTGQCWPGGHASGGFALMGIMAFASRQNWRKRLLLSVPGFVLGWVMGVFQMVRGHHFLSHTVATLGIALLVIWALEAIISYRNHKKYVPDENTLLS
ncbi:MAG: phosphatase PAP2 family protein [Rhodospirillales bacterium]|nr:phosphatase PAP2 family protein [Rhodospirillales bacterium]